MIDRTLPLPIYHQLETLIREQIESGLWRPGERIPTETELCNQYGISRAPVRQALAALAADGLLSRRPGLGTFVNHLDAAASATGSPVESMIMEQSQWSKVLAEVAKAWNADHPHHTVAFRSETVPHTAFYERLISAVGSGTAPDLAVVDSVWVAGLARSGFLYALQDLDAQGTLPSFARDLYPALVRANSFDGMLYALPCTVDASLLWYRKDWFAEEGLAPPKDWNDLLRVVRHFLQPHVQQRYGLKQPLAFPGGSAAGEATVYALMPLVWSAGGDICNSRAVVLDCEGTRAALQFLRELVSVCQLDTAEVVHYHSDTAPKLFACGKAAMALGGSYEASNLREWSGWRGPAFAERVGCVLTPSAPGARPVSTLGGTSYVVMRQCQRPALVRELLRVASNAQVVGNVYRSVLLASASPSFNAALPAGGELPLNVVTQMVAYGRARPSIPDYVRVSRQLRAMFESAISTSIPVEEIVYRCAQFIAVISERPCERT
jgi:ABC-type glycerol-3-phosphate transport system substrate-binding protein